MSNIPNTMILFPHLEPHSLQGLTPQRKILIVSAVTVISVASGIAMVINWRPAPYYNPIEVAITHWWFGATCLTIGAVAGIFWTKRFAPTLMLSLAALFGGIGMVFMLNGALDRSPARPLKFVVIEKNREYVDAGSNPGYWDYYLRGKNAKGLEHRFSTAVGLISQDGWRGAQVDGECHVLVMEHRGALGITWWSDDIIVAK